MSEYQNKVIDECQRRIEVAIKQRDRAIEIVKKQYDVIMRTMVDDPSDRDAAFEKLMKHIMEGK
jgi:iron-sulfur cluster repair protein YtfE (RIC family)